MILKQINILILILACLSFNANSSATASLSQVTLNDHKITYEQLLSRHKMAGLSMAVVDNYKVIYQRTAGVREFAGNDKVDHQTAFSAGSISKPVTAIIAAMLAEKGVLNLDTPVVKYLKKWRFPQAFFPQSQSITIRHLLSHTAGTNQAGFSHYSLGDVVPTLEDSLNGNKIHSDEEAILLLSEPGSKWRYSGGGFVIVQLAIEDLTGKTLAELAETMLFRPLGMHHTTMYQYGHPKFLSNVAKAHVEYQVVDDGIPILPQVGAAGMWTNASDLAKLIIDFQKALSNQNTQVISNWVAKTTTEIQTLDLTGGWGLGWMRFRADANLDWFSHSGYNQGTGGLVMASMQQGRAIIILGNGHHYPSRVPIINTIIKNTIKVLNWKQPLQLADICPEQKQVSAITGYYLNMSSSFFSPFGKVIKIEARDDKIMLIDGRRQLKQLHYVGQGKFVIDEFVNNELSVSKNPVDGKMYLTLTRKGSQLSSFVMRRLTTGEIERLKSM